MMYHPSWGQHNRSDNATPIHRRRARHVSLVGLFHYRDDRHH